MKSDEVLITDRAWFDIQIGDEPAARVVFGLLGTDAPHTVENFLQLAKGVTENGKFFGYSGSYFTRLTPWYLQGWYFKFYKIYANNFRHLILIHHN